MSEVFSKLSGVNVNKQKEKKGKFDYLPWTDAWTILMEHYPNATHDILEDVYYPDGTMEVRSSVTVEGQTLKMFLPVIDHRNQAITNPNAFDINKNRMRCLAKNIALFGLGLYVFRGEDLPSNPTYTEAQKDEFYGLVAQDDGFGLKRFGQNVDQSIMDDLFNAAPQGQKTSVKEKVRKAVQKANTHLKATLGEFERLVSEGAGADAFTEVWEELEPLEKEFVIAGMDEVLTRQVSEQLGGLE